MAIPNGKHRGDASLVFAAQNKHSESCGLPPRVWNTDNLERYYGYFENVYGEQLVFTFNPATGEGTISGGDLDWDNPKPFSLELVKERSAAPRTWPHRS